MTRALAYGFLLALAISACVCCGTELHSAGPGGKHGGRPELGAESGELGPEVDAAVQDASMPPVDASTPPADAQDDAEAPRIDAGSTPDVGTPSALAGAWRVSLTRTYGNGCSGFAAVDTVIWTVSPDGESLTSGAGTLALIEPAYFQGTLAPPSGGHIVVDLMLTVAMATALTGDLTVDRTGCLESWTVAGRR